MIATFGNNIAHAASWLDHQLFGSGTDDFHFANFGQTLGAAAKEHLGNASNTFDHYLSAPTYGLPYLSILQGDPLGTYLPTAVSASGGLLVVLLSPETALTAGIDEISEIDMGDLVTRQNAVSGPRVERYVARLLAGDVPPPITYDEEGAIIEGNHRYVASQIAKIPIPRTPGVGPSNPRPIVPWNKVFFDPVDW